MAAASASERSSASAGARRRRSRRRRRRRRPLECGGCQLAHALPGQREGEAHGGEAEDDREPSAASAATVRRESRPRLSAARLRSRRSAGGPYSSYGRIVGGRRIAVELELRGEPVLALDERSRAAATALSAASGRWPRPRIFEMSACTSASSLRTMTGSIAGALDVLVGEDEDASFGDLDEAGADGALLRLAARAVRDDARARSDASIGRWPGRTPNSPSTLGAVTSSDVDRERAALRASRSRARSCRRPWRALLASSALRRASAALAFIASMLPTR